ncbi:MAG: flagellar motor protein MotB [Desulfobacterota bacterium]|nr:flagellar motor protein MotB [Thermodesulfobacteriota bacterium]
MSTRIASEHYEPRERWLLTFNDIMTLMLTFFVLVLSMCSLDLGAVQNIQQEMARALRGPERRITTEPGIGGIPTFIEQPRLTIKAPAQSDQETHRRMTDDTSMSAIATVLQDIFKIPVVDEKTVVADPGSRSGTARQYPGVIDERYYEPGVVLLHQNRGVVLRLPGSVLFQTGSADLTDRAYPLLDAVATALVKTGLHVLIEGHTDARPVITARYASNWELSAARAARVAEYLVEHHGINPKRIGVSGYADRRPLVPNDTERNRDLNRRVEIVFEQPSA